MRMKKNKEKKEKKIEPEDDGRTVVDMNVDGFSWYQPNRPNKKEKFKKDDPDKPTKRELIAMIKAAYLAALPYALIALGCLTAVFVLGYIWLK